MTAGVERKAHFCLLTYKGFLFILSRLSFTFSLLPMENTRMAVAAEEISKQITATVYHLDGSFPLKLC